MAIKKRTALSFVSLILVVVFLVTPFSVAADAETQGQCGPSLYWSFDSIKGVLTVSGQGPMYDYDNFSVAVDCAPFSDYRTKVKKLVIEEGCTKIGRYAFSGFTNLTIVSFPESSLKEIGAYAFNYCVELPRMIIPDSVTVLGDYAFTTCQKLKMIRFGKGITAIPAGVCRRSSALTDVFFTENCKTIGNAAFYECPKLANIDISNVENVEANSFFSCTSLKSIRFGENIKTIGTNSFYGCSALSEIIFDGTPESIASAFSYGSAWHNSHEIGMYTICKGEILMCRGPYNVTEIVIPDGVKMIADSAFANNTTITKVTLPESLEIIGALAFSRADALKEITIPDGVKEIRRNALGYKTEGTSGSVVNPNYVIIGRGRGVAYNYAVTNGVLYNCLHEFEYVTQSENCIEGIFKLKKCTYCGIVTEKTALPVNDSHSFVEKVTLPDCENDGYTLYECENCAFSEIGNKVDAKGHSSSGTWELVSAPACDRYGRFAVLCTECGCALEEKLIEKKGHTKSDTLRTVKEEGCTEDGIYEEFCKVCSATLSTVITEAKGHMPEADFKEAIPYEEGSAGCDIKICNTCKAATEIVWFIFADGEKVIIDKSEARDLCLASMEIAFAGQSEVSVESYDFNFDGKLNAKDSVAVKLMTR